MTKKLLIALLIFLASACTEQELLVSDVDERSSVEIMVVLQEVGVAAQRIPLSLGSDSRFKIQVVPAEYSKALNILHQYGLPKEEKDSLASITKPQGFSPNPPEIAALRLDHALSLEIERMLTGFPGVVEVKALVRSSFKVGGVVPNVSVVIRYASIDESLPFSAEAVRKLVLQSIPSLDPAAVNLTTHRISSFSKDEEKNEFISFSPFNFEIKKTQKSTIQKQLSVMLGSLCFFAGLIGIIIGWKFSKRSTQKQMSQAKVVLGSSNREALPGTAQE